MRFSEKRPMIFPSGPPRAPVRESAVRPPETSPVLLGVGIEHQRILCSVHDSPGRLEFGDSHSEPALINPDPQSASLIQVPTTHY